MNIIIGGIFVLISLYILYIVCHIWTMMQCKFSSKQSAIEYWIEKTVYISDGKKWHKIIGHYEMGPQYNKVVTKLPKQMKRGELVETHTQPWWSHLVCKVLYNN